MGLLSKFERQPPATTTDYVEEAVASSPVDVEKAHVEMQDEGNAVVHHHHIDPEAEKRVVRKLDWRVTPLVSALCMSKIFHSHRSSLTGCRQILSPFLIDRILGMCRVLI